MHGGAADRSGLIFPGDEVIEVNGYATDGKTPDDVLQILKASEGTITFKLVPGDTGKHKVERDKWQMKRKMNESHGETLKKKVIRKKLTG